MEGSIGFLSETRARDWVGEYIAVVMAVFCIAFYFPLTSKTINNFFYVAIALPCLFFVMVKPRAMLVLLKEFSWFFVLLLALIVVNAEDFSDFKKFLYLFLFFVACVFLDRSRWMRPGGIALITLASCGIFLLILFDWLLMWRGSGHLTRYGVLWGERINPVYFSLLISSALIVLWLFCIEGWLKQRGRLAFLAGFSALMVLVLLCSVVFQSRTTLLGLAFFLVGYALQRGGVLQVALLGLLLALLIVFSGAIDVLMQRGFSYRLEIWQDAWARLSGVCSIWWGCGDDGYRFLGKFHHAHSGYVSMLYRNGLVGGLMFGILAVLFFWRSSRACSRWMLVALFGWGSLVTTTGGVLTTPKPLWVYFWLPTFLAMLEAQKDAVNEFFTTHCLGSVRKVGLS